MKKAKLPVLDSKLHKHLGHFANLDIIAAGHNSILTTKARKALPNQDFALPGRGYPIPDESHGRNALARVSQFGSPDEKATVRAKVRAKFPGIKQGQ